MTRAEASIAASKARKRAMLRAEAAAILRERLLSDEGCEYLRLTASDARFILARLEE